MLSLLLNSFMCDEFAEYVVRWLERAQLGDARIRAGTSPPVEPHGSNPRGLSAENVGGPGVTDHDGLFARELQLIERDLEDRRIRLGRARFLGRDQYVD